MARISQMFLMAFYQVTILIYTITDGVHFDHLVKVVSLPGFPTERLLTFPFVVSKHFVGRYLKVSKYLIKFSFYSFIY